MLLKPLLLYMYLYKGEVIRVFTYVNVHEPCQHLVWYAAKLTNVVRKHHET
jgi:hypothetical protein